MRRRIHGVLDCKCPIEWSHPLNRGLSNAWAVSPLAGWNRSNVFRDLVRGGKPSNDGSILTTNLAQVNWVGSSRIGSYGALQFVSNTPSAGTDWVQTSVTPKNVFSIEVCILATSTALNGNNCGVYSTYDFGNFNGIYFATQGGGSTMQFWSDGNNRQFLNTVFAAGKWYHIVFVSTGSAVSCYVNGALDVTQAGGTTTHAAALYIGRSRFNGDYWDGQLDGIYLYNRILSAVEVAALYQQTQRGNPDRWRWIKTTAWLLPTVGATSGLLMKRRRALAQCSI